ncbi:UNVERIFIED_CONTAM: hypothetical protein HDU68_012285 [Siphonaria sp. JEL0065]|nr:hypothetical protein HDU68_012285 [Siphonaria sp. JEL0065]
MADVSTPGLSLQEPSRAVTPIRYLNAETRATVRDFSNSTLEEIIASQTQYVRPRTADRQKTRAKTPRLSTTSRPTTGGDEKCDNVDEAFQNEQTEINQDEDEKEPITSRWQLSEQRFLELFFGQDLVLRSRQRHQHVLQSMKQWPNRPQSSGIHITTPNPQSKTTRPKSALQQSNNATAKNVSFNLTKNLQYDFSPFPNDPSSINRPDTAATTDDEEMEDEGDGNEGDYTTSSRKLKSLALFDYKHLNDFRKTKSGTNKADGVRIPRPRTAELSPELKKRLEEFRELDTFVFVKPMSQQRSNPTRESMRDCASSAASFAASIKVSPGSRKMSTAARLLLARAGSASTLNSSSAGSAKSNNRQHQQNTQQQQNNQRRNLGSATSSSSRMTTRSIDSAHTFNPPSNNQVISKNSYAIPKHKRPLSRGVRRFLVNAVVEDSVHPKLGAKAVVNLLDHQQHEKHIHQLDSALKHVLDTDAGKNIQVAKSLHYHLHPPSLPQPGLSLEPYDAAAMKPSTNVFKLEIPRKLRQSLEDPRNLVGLEGGKVGGRIVMRKISCLYEVPKCPRVNGRITPVQSIEDIAANIGSHAVKDGILAERRSIQPIQDPESSEEDEVGIDDHQNEPTVNEIIQSMVLTNAEHDEMLADIATPSSRNREHHRKNKAEVRSSFVKMVGSMFPLDYFMDYEEIQVLVQKIQEWKETSGIPDIRCQGLIQSFSKATRSKKQVDEVWHGGHLTDYDASIHQFRVEWDEPYPNRRPINYIHVPDPSKSSRWLSRAEIKLDRETLQGHLNRIVKANSIRVEFESRLTLTQICGIVAPVLTPALPEFKKEIVDLMYKQVSVIQSTFMKSSLRSSWREIGQENEDDIHTFQTSFIAQILNELREAYFLSQVEASIKQNPRLENLYIPKKIKAILAQSDMTTTTPHFESANAFPKNRKSYCIKESSSDSSFQKNMAQVRYSPFLYYRELLEKILGHLKVYMMLDSKIGDLITHVCQKTTLVPRLEEKDIWTISKHEAEQELLHRHHHHHHHRHRHHHDHSNQKELHEGEPKLHSRHGQNNHSQVSSNLHHPNTSHIGHEQKHSHGSNQLHHSNADHIGQEQKHRHVSTHLNSSNAEEIGHEKSHTNLTSTTKSNTVKFAKVAKRTAKIPTTTKPTTPIKNAPPILRVDMIHKTTIGHAWNDMYIYKNELYNTKKPLFNEDGKDIEIAVVVRQNISSLRVIALQDFQSLTEYLFIKFRSGLNSSLGALASQEYAKAIKRQHEGKKHNKAPLKPISEESITAIVQANLSTFIKARYLDFIKVLRDQELKIGVDTRLLITLVPDEDNSLTSSSMKAKSEPHFINPEFMRSNIYGGGSENVGARRASVAAPTARRVSLATQEEPVVQVQPTLFNPLLYPTPPFVSRVQIIAYPEVAKVCETVETMFKSWLYEHLLNLFPHATPSETSSKKNKSNQHENHPQTPQILVSTPEEMPQQKTFTSTPIDHRALEMISKELISDTLESAQALLIDRQTLIGQWVEEFEVSVKQGLWKLMQEPVATTILKSPAATNANKGSDVASSSLPAFPHTVRQLHAGFEAALQMLSLISQRAAYTFHPSLTPISARFSDTTSAAATNNNLEKSLYYKQIAATSYGTCEFEIRGFTAIRCTLLHTGMEMWVGRWKEWVHECVSVLLEKGCTELKIGYAELEQLWKEKELKEENVIQEEGGATVNSRPLTREAGPEQPATRVKLNHQQSNESGSSIANVENVSIITASKPGTPKRSKCNTPKKGSKPGTPTRRTKTPKITRPSICRDLEGLIDALDNLEREMLEPHQILIPENQEIQYWWISGRIKLKLLLALF